MDQTETLPEQVLANFRSPIDSTWAIQSFGKESLVAVMMLQAFVPAIFTTVMTPGALSKFLGSPVNLPSTNVNLNGVSSDPSSEMRDHSQAPVPQGHCKTFPLPLPSEITVVE